MWFQAPLPPDRRSGPALARNVLIAPLQLLSNAHDGKLLKPRSTVEALPALPNQTKLFGQFCRLRSRQITAFNAFEPLGNVSDVHRDYRKAARQGFLHNVG